MKSERNKEPMKITSLRSLLILLLSLLAACSLQSGAPEISQQELLKMIASGNRMLLLDVRTTGEYAEGYIAQAKHIDHRDIDKRLHEIIAYKTDPVVVYCLSGLRAAMVESSLIDAGFTQVLHLQGDWSAWQAAALPVTKAAEKTDQQ